MFDYGDLHTEESLLKALSSGSDELVGLSSGPSSNFCNQAVWDYENLLERFHNITISTTGDVGDSASLLEILANISSASDRQSNCQTDPLTGISEVVPFNSEAMQQENIPSQQQMQFNPDFGWGIANAAAAVANAAGKSAPFSDVPNRVANTYGPDLVKAPSVWQQGITGKGVTVAVIDTGIDVKHPDLQQNIWRNPGEIPGDGIDNDRNGYVDDVNGYDFVNNDGDPSNNSRNERHGSHVAGIIAAGRNGVDVADRAGNRFDVTGIAPDAKIMPVRVLNSNGQGRPESVANGIRYAVDNGARVINLSLGSPMSSPLIRDAISYAEKRGAVVISAAGNSGFFADGPAFPARLAATSDKGIAVGAVDRNRNTALFSNPAGLTTKPYPFVVAPGVRILSTTPNNSYTFLSGTSMATPHVTGVVALMLQANPNLSSEDVKRILSTTASPNVAMG